MASEAEMESADSGMEPPGARLRAGREAAGLKLADVALELRLSVDTIDALEHDAAEKLPAPIFVRGYVRNYAALLGLPAQELVEAYNASVGGAQNQGLRAGPMQQQLVGARRRNYLVWLLVLVIAVAAGWWFQQRTASPPGRSSVTGQAPLKMSAKRKHRLQLPTMPVSQAKAVSRPQDSRDSPCSREAVRLKRPGTMATCRLRHSRWCRRRTMSGRPAKMLRHRQRPLLSNRRRPVPSRRPRLRRNRRKLSRATR